MRCIGRWVIARIDWAGGCKLSSSGVVLVQTPIGQWLRNSPGRLAIACTIGVAAISGDLVLMWWNPRYADVVDGRWLIAVGALAVNLHLVRGDLASIGLTTKPIQGWRYWVWAT